MQTARSMRERLVLVLVAGIGMTWATASIFGGGRETTNEAVQAARGEAGATEKQIVVYYFHGTLRCKTCRTIEAYAKEAVEGRYGDQLKSGLLKWQVVNLDEAGNEHFVEEFDLVSSSLVLAERSRGKITRHQILQDAWTLVRDKPRFVEYVQHSVGGYLKP